MQSIGLILVYLIYRLLLGMVGGGGWKRGQIPGPHPRWHLSPVFIVGKKFLPASVFPVGI